MFSALIGFIISQMLFVALHLESRILPKPLGAKEEKEEFIKYKNGDMAARDKIIKHNLRLVAHISKKYYQSSVDNEDLMSIGTIGLIKAVQNFSHEKNTRFSTYAARCIENEILMAFRKQKPHENIASLDENLGVDNDTSALTLKDNLKDDFSIEKYCEEKELKEEITKLVMEKLNGRERQIIIMRYGLNNTKSLTQQNICEILGISRSYVSRIESKALEKLKSAYLNKIDTKENIF